MSERYPASSITAKLFKADHDRRIDGAIEYFVAPAPAAETR